MLNLSSETLGRVIDAIDTASKLTLPYLREAAWNAIGRMLGGKKLVFRGHVTVVDGDPATADPTVGVTLTVERINGVTKITPGFVNPFDDLAAPQVLVEALRAHNDAVARADAERAK